MFLEHYILLDDANDARDKHYEIKQPGAVQDFIAAFNNIVVLLPDLPEADQVHAFMYGLKLYIFKFVNA